MLKYGWGGGGGIFFLIRFCSFFIVLDLLLTPPYVNFFSLKLIILHPFIKLSRALLLGSPLVIVWKYDICIDLYIRVRCPPGIFLDLYDYFHTRQKESPLLMVF